MNEIDYEQLLSLIEKVVENKVYQILNNLGIESSSYGVVSDIEEVLTNAEGDIIRVVRASIVLPDGEKVENLYNASGEVLAIGDKVKIYGSRTNMSNRYIGIKYEGEVIL